LDDTPRVVESEKRQQNNTDWHNPVSASMAVTELPRRSGF
jgi:hypothetical protein